MDILILYGDRGNRIRDNLGQSVSGQWDSEQFGIGAIGIGAIRWNRHRLIQGNGIGANGIRIIRVFGFRSIRNRGNLIRDNRNWSNLGQSESPSCVGNHGLAIEIVQLWAIGDGAIWIEAIQVNRNPVNSGQSAFQGGTHLDLRRFRGTHHLCIYCLVPILI